MVHWSEWRTCINQVSGRITYNGLDLESFVPRRTAAYIAQEDNHMGLLTVRETLQFAAMCQGVGHKAEELQALRKAERAAGVEPDVDIDALQKAIAQRGKRGYDNAAVEVRAYVSRCCCCTMVSVVCTLVC